MSKKNQISYTEPSKPSFIRAFKEKAGYKEGPTLSDKFEPNPDDGKPEDEIDPKQELLEMINNNQLSIAESESCGLTKENLKDVLQGKDLVAIAAEREKKEQEIALKEAAKLPYDEKRDGKIVYRPPPPSSKKKRVSEDDQLQAENNSSKRSKEKQVNKRLLTCIPSDEDESSNDD